jgi:hypothetical protein
MVAGGGRTPAPFSSKEHASRGGRIEMGTLRDELDCRLQAARGAGRGGWPYFCTFFRIALSP